MNDFAKRHMWNIVSDYDTVVSRLDELQADYKIYNTLSNYFIEQDNMLIVEAISEVTFEDQHKEIPGGMYSEPDSSYEINEFARIDDIWTPIRFQSPITREEFYENMTRTDTSSIINCVHINAEVNGRSYRFDFNFEKYLNTLTLICDGETCDKSIKTFKNIIGDSITEDEYREIAFDFS